MAIVTPEILEPEEVADMLRVSVRTVTRLVDDGLLEGFKVGDMLRFYKSDIEKYIEEQKLKLKEEKRKQKLNRKAKQEQKKEGKEA
jgi:excisionase family DNA binding protein